VSAGGDDVRSLLAYEGATVDGELRSLDTDIVVLPFWTAGFCDLVIRAAEAVGAFAPQPDDPVPGREVSLAAIAPRLFERVEHDLGVRIWPRLQTVWPFIDYHGLRDAFVIRYAPGEQEHLRIHHDIAQLSGSVKLNADYSGAELAFPRQQVSNETTEVGELLVWPSLVTHPHETRPLRSGVKYALTVWFELPAF
jgi:hypothetical protein